jgi:hypothetical protein
MSQNFKEYFVQKVLEHLNELTNCRTELKKYKDICEERLCKLCLTPFPNRKNYFPSCNKCADINCDACREMGPLRCGACDNLFCIDCIVYKHSSWCDYYNPLCNTCYASELKKWHNLS